MQGLYKQLCNTTLEIEGVFGCEWTHVTFNQFHFLILLVVCMCQWLCIEVMDLCGYTFFLQTTYKLCNTKFQFEGVFGFQHVSEDSCS